MSSTMIEKGRAITMLDRLNGWQRIGVILAGLWILFVFGSGVIGYSNLETGRGAFVRTIPGRVVQVQKGNAGAVMDESAPVDVDALLAAQASGAPLPGAASSKSAAAYVTRKLPDRHVFQLGDMVVAAFAPPVLTWLLFYAALATIRWVAKGFNRKWD